MPEIVGNLHLHTTASDGTGTHDEVALAAARAGLDFIIYTDHNAWVEDVEGWFCVPDSGRKILRLMGQEVNDTNLDPELNHLLCHLISCDLEHAAADPQQLIDTVLAKGGLCFLAHPLERPGYERARQTYPWVNWEISGFTGIEIWNAMTDVKWQLRTMYRGIIGAYLPNLALNAPFPEVLAKWDELLAKGQRVVAIGNSDAHAMSFSLGPLRRTIYPYEYLFRAVNTHVLIVEPLAQDVRQARLQIYEALKRGHCFVSYDLIGSSHGFSFTARSGQEQVMMGDALVLDKSATLYVSSPQPASLRLLQNGRLVAKTNGATLEWTTTQPGVYRVEAYRQFWGRQCGWVFTNPIYVESEPRGV